MNTIPQEIIPSFCEDCKWKYSCNLKSKYKSCEKHGGKETYYNK